MEYGSYGVFCDWVEENYPSSVVKVLRDLPADHGEIDQLMIADSGDGHVAIIVFTDRGRFLSARVSVPDPVARGRLLSEGERYGFFPAPDPSYLPKTIYGKPCYVEPGGIDLPQFMQPAADLLTGSLQDHGTPLAERERQTGFRGLKSRRHDRQDLRLRGTNSRTRSRGRNGSGRSRRSRGRA